MRKILKIFLYLIGSILVLLIVAIVILQLPWGKNLVREKIVAFLSDKLKTEVVIQDLDYRIPTSVELKGVLLIDLQKDTLLSLQHLKVDINMLALLGKKISVNNLLLDGVNAHVYRSAPDSLFNYNFIIAAFAGTDTTQKTAPTDTTPSSLTYDVGKVELKNIRFRYDDTSGGTLFSANLSNLVLRPKRIDLNKSIFSINELSVAGLTSSFIIDTSYLPKVVDTSAASDFQISADRIDLKDVGFKMLNRIDSMYMNYDIGHLKTELKQFGLLAQLVELGDLMLENANTEIVMGKPQQKQIVAEIVDPDSMVNNWRVFANTIAVNKLNFLMDDNGKVRLKKGVDYGHLKIDDFFFNAQNVVYGPDTISADLKHLAFREKSGLNIMELRSKVLYSNTGAQLSELYLLTPNTLLQDKLFVSYPSLAALSNAPNQMRLDIAFDKSKVGINDVLYFMDAEQQKQLLPYKNQSLALTAKLSGFLNALLIDRLYLAGLSGTIVDIKGKLNGLPDSKKLFYDLDLKQVRTSYRDIAAFLPDSLKQQFDIPQNIAINGKVHGSMEDYFPDLLIRTSDGDATVKGALAMSGGKNKEKYDLVVSTTTLNLGKILRQPDSVLGKISLVADLKGESFDPQFMNTTFSAKINAADAMKYNYNNIQLNGNINHKKAVFNGVSSDPNIDFLLSGTANLENTYPAIFANLKMKNVDLYALHLMSDTLSFKGDILADFSSVNPDYPAGNFSWVNGHLTMPGVSLPLDSIIFNSNPIDSLQNYYLNVSNILYTSLTGHMPLTKVGDAMLSHLNRHYKIQDTVISDVNNYDMKLTAFVNYSPLLNRWMPDLRPFDTIRIHSGLSPDTFGLFASIPRLIKGTNQLDSTFVRIRENKDTFSYNIGLKRFTAGNIQLWAPSLRGLIKNDSIYALVTIKDSALNTQFALGGSMTQNLRNDSGLTYIRLFKGLRFDYEKWDVNPANEIVLSPNGYFIKNFDISKGNQSISINSKNELPKSPFSILIKNFQLANITNMISRDTLLAEGQLNMDANLDLSDSFPKIDVTASIMNLMAFQNPVGQLELTAKNENDNIYNAFLKLSGQENDVQVKGDYYMTPVNDNNFDFKLDMNNLSLKSMEGLTFGALKNSSGALTGNLHINGTTDKPEIAGQLKTKELKTTVSMLNAPFLMSSETIDFKPGSISFRNFRVKDLNDKAATLNGDIQTKDFKSYLLDLQFRANRWQPIHSVKQDNPEFYGDIIMTTNLDIKGSAFAPKIDGSLTLHDSTNFTYAMLDKGPGVVGHEGIVEFMDSRDTFYIDSSQLVSNSMAKLSEAAQMNVNVDIEKNAKFQVLIDPVSGDMLQVMGDAQLNTFIAPDGSIGITGVYELDNGYYELNYNFLRRKFLIEKGSTITLAGDVLDAEADITAVYNATIAPYDLVEQQASPDQLVFYKQRLPFQVLLKIKGKALKPEISFDIVLPESQTNSVSADVSSLVQAKLSEMRLNPSELNKQVFAILILGRFISDDPFSSGSGGGMEYAVRQSVSKFLSEQLNQLAGGLVTGLELNVGLNSSEDYTTGTKQNRTDLDISASKRFMNDRLKITVGNNFELEGQAAQQQQTSLIPGDLSIDYQITKDGRYVVRAYRSNELQNLVDGYTVETGLSFRLSVEYNKLKTVFTNRKNYRKKMKERRSQEREKEMQNQDSAKLEEDISFIKKQAPLK